MTDKTINLDGRRGMEAQKATDLRRLLAEVEANERTLRLCQEELEAHLADAPAVDEGFRSTSRRIWAMARRLSSTVHSAAKMTFLSVSSLISIE
jgi:hypothetical protein